MGHWRVLCLHGCFMALFIFVHGVKSKFVSMRLGIYIVAETIIFLPLLMIAQVAAAEAGLAANSLIFRAAMITLSGFVALTAIAFVTRKNFS